MEEKMITGKKHGMAALFGILLLFALSIAALIAGGMIIDSSGNPVLFIIAIFGLGAAIILCGGLKVLKPQEALC